jgi:hypothetical protein
MANGHAMVVKRQLTGPVAHPGVAQNSYATNGDATPLTYPRAANAGTAIAAGVKAPSTDGRDKASTS